MSRIIIYHGSSEIVEKPVFGKGKAYNDFGRGFYCTQHLELAKEWACTEGVDGYANQYELEMEDLRILKLFSDEYSILHWLTVLIENRQFRLSTPIIRKGADWLKDNFSVPLNEYDIVMGYRADDSYFSFARAFLSNEISLKQLSYAMNLGELGTQIVLKSEKAFQNLKFVSYSFANNSIYYARRKARDDKARKAYIEELEKEDVNGIFMRDIIREEMKGNDSRI